MRILEVDYPINTKCYIAFDGAIRECIFLGTKGINEGNITNIYYMLFVAGEYPGIIYVKFDSMSAMSGLWRDTRCKTILYRTIEDCINHTNPIQANYGSTSDCYHAKFMQKFFQNCKVCNVGGHIEGYCWNGIEAVPVTCSLDSDEYTIDEHGFSMKGQVHPAWSGMKMLEGDARVYRTKQECKNDNQVKVITF